MHDSDRFQLLGTYETPLFEYGQVVFCERLGEVELVGLTDAKNAEPFVIPAIVVFFVKAKIIVVQTPTIGWYGGD